MKLRARLFVIAAAATVPMLLALLCMNALLQHRAAEQRLIGYVLSRMPAARRACEAAPEAFGGKPLAPSRLAPEHGPAHGPPEDGPPPRARPAVLFAYGEDLRSRNPAAPALSATLRSGIRDNSVAIAPLSWLWPTVEVLVRMPWGTGPCAVVLGRGSTAPEWGSILPDTPLWLLPTLVVLCAVLLATGPVIRRLRELTEAVQRLASSSYEGAVPIHGQDEIAHLARAFDVAARQIRAQFREKDRREQALRDFLANTTHDVMIPLTVLLGHLVTQRERLAAGQPVDAGALISAMDEAHYMGSLVHNLAMAARLEAAEVELQLSAVDLNALVGRVVGRHRPIAQELKVSLDSAVPAEPVVVMADVTLIEQAMSNVVYNAVRYNRVGGHVALILEPSEGDGFVVRVIDDGPGIPTAELSRLLARGARGDEARTRAPGGQGLGLHIAFRAAELHGLRLTLQPSEYGGLEVKLAGWISAFTHS